MNCSPQTNRIPQLLAFLLIATLLLVTLTLEAKAQTLKLTLTYNGEIYGLSDTVVISGNLTLDGTPVQNALVAVQVLDSASLYLTFRTVLTGSTPPTNYLVNFTYMYTCDVNGNPKSTFSIGESLCIAYSIKNYDTEPNNVTIAISLYDPQNVPVMVWVPARLRLEPGASSSAVFLATSVTSDFTLGQYTLYGNLYSNLPSDLGTPYCPEKTATFTASSAGSAGKSENLIFQTMQTGVFETSFKLPKVGRIGTYSVYVSTSYSGLGAFSSMGIPVVLIGDINDDYWVEIMDFFYMSQAFGSTPESPNWNGKCDIYPWPEGDEYVEMMDFLLLSLHFGDHVLGY